MTGSIVDIEPAGEDPRSKDNRFTGVLQRRQRREPLGSVGFVLGLAFTTLLLLPGRLVFPPIGAEGRPATMLGFGLFAWWCLMKLVPRFAPRNRQPLRIALWILLGTLLLSWLAGLDRGPLPIETSAMDRTMLARLALIGLALVIADGVRSRHTLDRLLVVLSYCGGIMGFIALLQFGFDYDIVPMLKFPPLEFNADLIGSRERGAGTRVTSTAGHSIELGVVAAMILPVAGHYAMRAATNNQRFFRWVATVLIAASIPFSGSRAGYVGFAVVIITMMWTWNTRTRANVGALILAGVVALQALTPGLLGTVRWLFLNLGVDDSATARVSDYEIVFDYIAARPILGRGPGTWLPEEYIVLDNEWLYTAVTLGIVGVVAIVGVILVALIQAGWVAHHGSTNETRHLAQALKASVLVGAITSATFDALAFATFSGVWFIMFGMVAALWRIEQDGTDADIDPAVETDFSQVLVSRRLTDPSKARPSMLQSMSDWTEARASR